MTTFKLKANIENFRSTMWWAGYEVRQMVRLLQSGCTCNDSHPPRLHKADCPVVNIEGDDEW